MIKLSKITFLNKILTSAPILILFISVLNEFDFNYLELKHFSFNLSLNLFFLLLSNNNPALPFCKNSGGPFLQLLDIINKLLIAASIITNPGSSHKDDRTNALAFFM